MAFNFTEYMRNIAISLKDIAHIEDDEDNKHFYRVSGLGMLEEVLQSLTKGKFPALIVEDNLFSRFYDGGSENFLDTQNYTFYICKQLNDYTDATGREEILKDCQEILYKIISKMIKDRRNDHACVQPLTGLRNLDISSFFIQSIGPIGDMCYGLMFSFTIVNPVAMDIIYNANDWI